MSKKGHCEMFNKCGISSEMLNKWGVSTDASSYDGSFDSVEEAIERGRSLGCDFWVARYVNPVQPELLFTYMSVRDWLDCTVYEHDDYWGDWAEGEVCPTREQMQELASRIRPLIAEWLDQEKLRPTFCVVAQSSIRKICKESLEAKE